MKTRSVIALTVANLALAATVHLAWSALPSGAAVKKIAPVPAVSEEDQIIGVIAKDSPAVVSIVIEAPAPKVTVRDSNGQVIQQITPEGSMQEVGRGTGFLVSADGMILTNRHVADDHISKYTVFLSDDRSFTAKVLDIDPVNDLALLKVDSSGLPHLDVAPTDKVRVGETVIAIGNALGKFSNTVTRGILSGVNRSIDATDPRTGRVEYLENVLQTDAAINSGNSGGPLLNLDGRVIGVNTAIESDGEGLGFAIPASEIRKVLASYAQFGSIARPRLGIRYLMITPEVALHNHLSLTDGALVQANGNLPAVVPGGPAEKAGLREGDIILEIGGKKIMDKVPLSNIIQSKNVGDQLKLKIARGSEVFDVIVSLDAYPPVTP